MKQLNTTGFRRALTASVAIVALAYPLSAAYASDGHADGSTGTGAPDAAQPAPATPAHAAAHDDNRDAPIIVTATRRSALLDQVPLSISVVTADTLQRDHVTNIVDLNGRLPSLMIGTSFGGSRIAIRGVGFNPIRPGDEGRVAFYTDGIYIARPSAQVGTLFDVERIEVLRGPQGTLYGRNATGGALLLTTRDPTRELSGYLNATVGNYNLYQFSGALSGPITDTLSARIAFETVNRGGYWRNLSTGRRVGNANTASFRATLLWEPSSNFSLRITADKHNEDDRNNVLHPIRPGITVDPYRSTFGARDISQIYDPSNSVQSYGASATARLKLNDQLTLTAVGGARHLRSDLLLVGTGTQDFSAVSYFVDDSNQYNAELQLTGDHGRFNWIIGATYFGEDQTPALRSALLGRAFSPAAPNSPVQGTWSTANLQTSAKAIFAEATLNITDQLSVTAGARYSWETKKALGEISAVNFSTAWNGPNLPNFGFVTVAPRAGYPRDSSADFNRWTPKLAINYQFSPSASAYLTYVQGFKSGGFNYGTAQAPYQPETITNYEAGLRLRAGRALTMRAAIFRYDYHNLQQTVQNQSPPGTFVLNTGSARIQGAEVEFVFRPVEGFQLDGNASVLDTRFGTYSTVNPSTLAVVDIGGNHVPQAPDYTLNLGAQYTARLPQGRLTFRGDFRRIGRTRYDIYETPFMIQPAYSVLGANITYETADNHWRGTLFVNNIGDTYAVNQLSLQVPQLGGGAVGNLITPRTFGMTIGYSF